MLSTISCLWDTGTSSALIKELEFTQLVVARKIAEFLDLKTPESYTGHSLRRTGSTLLGDSGANISVLKRFGGWKSNTVAERYVQDSLASKNKIARNHQEKESSSKTVPSGGNGGNTNSNVNTNVAVTTIRHKEISAMQVNGNENCTIYITFQDSKYT